ncbi:hypothetical protein [Methyloprofundus sp.]|uniref:hypothetical protein n=1 Tax=Methyloprofundus sp. TaxID=2020875 RepID=UPI003D12C255
MDVVDKQTRSRMMANIKGKNTRPEMTIRSLLHRQGFRFRLHDKSLPGKPDLVLRKYKAVILFIAVTRVDTKTVNWPAPQSKTQSSG